MKKNHGFTLVELLIVVLMIAVLSATVIKQYNKYKIKALDTRSLASLRQLIVAQENYYIDNETFAASTTAIPNWVDDQRITIQITRSDNDSWAGYSYHSGGVYKHCFNANTKSGIVSIVDTAAGSTARMSASTACP